MATKFKGRAKAGLSLEIFGFETPSVFDSATGVASTSAIYLVKGLHLLYAIVVTVHAHKVRAPLNLADVCISRSGVNCENRRLLTFRRFNWTL